MARLLLLRGGWMYNKIAVHPSWGYVKIERYLLKIAKCCVVSGRTEAVRNLGILFAQDYKLVQFKHTFFLGN